MSIFIRSFMVERDTKNTRRFQELPEAGDPVLIGPLYIQKEALKAMTGNGSFPEKVQVTVQVIED